MSLYEIAGGDAERLLALLDRAHSAAAAQGEETAEIYTCYDAGYDGFWLHRLLEARGIHNSVLDSASIQVSRGGGASRPIADAIQDVTRRGDLVFDSFLGSGTTPKTSRLTRSSTG